MALGNRIRKNGKTLWLAGGLLILAVVGVVDYASAAALSLSVFYMVPILLLSWYVGLWAGLLAFVLSAMDLLVSELLHQPSGGRFLPIWNASLELVLFLVVIYLTTSLKKTLERERRFARTDHTTGAMNARAFEEYAERELSRLARYKKPFTIAYADLDDFKTINDRFGHVTGDAVLSKLAETVREGIRGGDVLARLGGDEFALLLPECGPKNAPAVLRRIHARIREVMKANGWPATVSIGAVTFASAPKSYEEMLAAIDGLMYEAKRGGKDSFRHETSSGGD